MKHKIIHESLIDATNFIENLVQSEKMLQGQDQGNVWIQFLDRGIYIQDQFGYIFQGILYDKYKHLQSPQNLNYFLIRKYVYKLNFNPDLLEEIKESIHNPIFTLIILRNQSIIYSYNQYKAKIKVRRGQKILRSVKIINDIHTLLYCSKYFVAVGNYYYFNKIGVIFINQNTGRSEKPIVIKHPCLGLKQHNIAVSKTGEFLYIAPKLYRIKSEALLKKCFKINMEYPQFSQDSSKLFGFDKQSSKILIVDFKYRSHPKINQIFYDFSNSLDRPLFMNFKNSQLILNDFQSREKDKYQLKQTVIAFDNQNQ